MESQLRRLARDRNGGAMAEYTILMAMAAGVQWIERATRDLDWMTLGGGAAVLLVLIGVVLRR